MTLVACTFVFDTAYRPLSPRVDPRNWYRKGVRLLRGELFFRWNCRSVQAWNCDTGFDSKGETVEWCVYFMMQNLESWKVWLLRVLIWFVDLLGCWDCLICRFFTRIVSLIEQLRKEESEEVCEKLRKIESYFVYLKKFWRSSWS